MHYIQRFLSQIKSVEDIKCENVDFMIICKKQSRFQLVEVKLCILTVA